MYQRDQKAIADYVDVGADKWQDRAMSVALAAAFTMRCQTPKVLERFNKAEGGYFYLQTKDIREEYYAGSHFRAFDMARAYVKVGDYPRALLALCELRGLGLAKSGFILQMIFGVVGCIDSENQKIYKVKVPELKGSQSAKRRHELACEYVALCETIGGTESVWDKWCDYMAEKNPNVWDSGDAVSLEHQEWVRRAARLLGVARCGGKGWSIRAGAMRSGPKLL